MAKLLVLAGALCQASSGETFLPGQGQMAGLRGLQARFWSSPPKRTGMRAPSLIEVEVRVIQAAAGACDRHGEIAASPIAAALMVRMICFSSCLKLNLAARNNLRKVRVVARAAFQSSPMALKIEYFEGVTRLDTVDFNGSEAEAISARRKAGLQAWDQASEARILDRARQGGRGRGAGLNAAILSVYGLIGFSRCIGGHPPVASVGKPGRQSCGSAGP